MSYVESLSKVRKECEEKVNSMLSQFHTESIVPLGVEFEDSWFTYSVKNKHLVLVDNVNTNEEVNVMEPDSIRLEELAEIADKLKEIREHDSVTSGN